MSHFLVHVIVDEGSDASVNKQVEKLLAPYDENLPDSPNPKWDWYRVGGRWDGDIRKAPSRSENGFNFSKVHEEIGNNSLSVADMLRESKGRIPFALVTPDGAWHERGEMGWFAAVSNEKDVDEWGKEYLKLIAPHEGKILVAVDCHI